MCITTITLIHIHTYHLALSSLLSGWHSGRHCYLMPPARSQPESRRNAPTACNGFVYKNVRVYQWRADDNPQYKRWILSLSLFGPEHAPWCWAVIAAMTLPRASRSLAKSRNKNCGNIYSAHMIVSFQLGTWIVALRLYFVIFRLHVTMLLYIICLIERPVKRFLCFFKTNIFPF